MATVAKAVWIPLPEDIIAAELQRLPGVQAALMATGRVVVTRMKANVSGPRVGPFAKRAFVQRDPEDEFTVLAGTKWKLAHLFEFGGAYSEPHGWLRSAAMAVPNTRFEPGGGP